MMKRSGQARHVFRMVVGFAVACLLLFGTVVSPASAATDIFISGLVLYTKLPPNSPEAKEHGLYPQITSYDRHAGLAPDKIDVVVVVNGEPPGEVTIVLEVFPVVGVTNWDHTEGITEPQLLESSKTKMPSFLRLEKTLRFRGRTEVTFSDIDLSKLIKHYTQRGFWPAEAIFIATAEPIRGETALSNNVMEFKLRMNPPD